MGVCNQIILLIIYYTSSRLVTVLNVLNTLILLLVSSSSILAFRYAFFFVPEMSASITSYIVQIFYSALASILYPLHFSLLTLIKKPKYSSFFFFE